MNAIVEVNFLPRTPPPDLGCRLREATFPARSRSRILRFQMLVDIWVRFYHDSLADLQERSRRYVGAYCQRAAARIDGAPERRPFPPAWQPDLQAQPDGVVIFIRRTSVTGTVSLLGRTFQADPLWPHRLVRCEVDLRAETVRFHALRRREPTHQPLLGKAPYVFSRKPFHE